MPIKRYKPSRKVKKMAGEATRAERWGKKTVKKAEKKINKLEKKAPVGKITQKVTVKKDGTTVTKSKETKRQSKLAGAKGKLARGKAAVATRAAVGRRRDVQSGRPKSSGMKTPLQQVTREKNETRKELRTRVKDTNKKIRASRKAKKKA